MGLWRNAEAALCTIHTMRWCESTPAHAFHLTSVQPNAAVGRACGLGRCLPVGLQNGCARGALALKNLIFASGDRHVHARQLTAISRLSGSLLLRQCQGQGVFSGVGALDARLVRPRADVHSSPGPPPVRPC